MTQGAVQLQVVINGQSLSIKKEHLVGLTVDRVIGDSANTFTLECYDETAWKLENALMGNNFANIVIKYSAAEDLTNAFEFSGICTDYQLSFVGRATMITITGIVATSLDSGSKIWFERANVEWVGDLMYDSNGNIIGVDGKTISETQNYENNRDVCAILDYGKDSNGNQLSVPRVFYNPTRIFERIIHTYNGDILGTESTSTTNSSSNVLSLYGGVAVEDTNSGWSEYQSLSVGNNERVVWNFFRSNGFSEASVAGIMGNIQQESSFDPTCIQNYGKGPAARFIPMGELYYAVR